MINKNERAHEQEQKYEAKEKIGGTVREQLGNSFICEIQCIMDLGDYSFLTALYIHFLISFF